jgi:hypothetical protein
MRQRVHIAKETKHVQIVLKTIRVGHYLGEGEKKLAVKRPYICGY